MRVSKKYRAFLRTNAKAEFLEGTTYSGKTTTGVYKFLLECAKSPKKAHILAGLDVGTIEKNIINSDHGILAEWGEAPYGLAEYNGNGSMSEKLPHLLFHTNNGVKKIYILGYGDKARWKKALGGQYGCMYIDEINIADMEFVREAAMRCDYLIATLNPDDPDLPIYSEYINRSRPLAEWKDDTPKEILDELVEKPEPGWVHWFFTFNDNVALTEEKKATIISNVPIGTKTYKNKIEGLRCKATGLIFGNFEYSRNVVSETWVKEQLEKYKRYVEGRTRPEDRGFKFRIFTCGIDTAYSSKSDDTIAMIFQGITDTGLLITLDEEVINNKDETIPVAPSDTVRRIIAFLYKNKDKWGLARYCYIDSADQATMTEIQKYVRQTGVPFGFFNAYKKTKIIDRIILQRGWIQRDSTSFLTTAQNILES